MEHIHLQLLQDYEGYKKGDVITISSVKLALRYVQDKIAKPYIPKRDRVDNCNQFGIGLRHESLV